jgi:TRAP-type uncharacterized transport system substrate-binding protein
MKGPLAMRRVALMFGALCAVLVIWYLAVRPVVLKVAVGPRQTSQFAYLEAITRLLRETRQPVRFQIVPVEGTQEASKLLDNRRVDLALLRSNDLGSADARSIAIVHKRAVILAARKDAGIGSLRELTGKRVVVAAGDGDSYLPFVLRILSHYEIDADELDLEELPRSEIPAAIATGRFQGEPQHVVGDRRQPEHRAERLGCTGA